MIITSNKSPEDDIKHPSAATGTRLENSYRVDATVTFPEKQAEAVVKEVLEEKLTARPYDPKIGNDLATDMANAIKTRVKALLVPRFKVVSFVVVGQKENAAVQTASRCMLNPKLDKFAEYSLTVGGMYAMAVVYALYQE